VLNFNNLVRIFLIGPNEMFLAFSSVHFDDYFVGSFSTGSAETDVGWGDCSHLMTCCVKNGRTKNCQNLTILLQITIDNVGDPFWDIVNITDHNEQSVWSSFSADDILSISVLTRQPVTSRPTQAAVLLVIKTVETRAGSGRELYTVSVSVVGLGLCYV